MKADRRLNRVEKPGCARLPGIATVEPRWFGQRRAPQPQWNIPMNGRFHRSSIALAVSLAVAMSAPAALAQTQPANPPQTPPAATTAQADTGPAPSDTELKNFAQAIVEVQGIKDSVQPRIAAATNPDDRTRLQQSAEKKMEAAVESHQLSPHRYVQIATLVQTDSNVRAKVQKLLPPQPQPKS
jgi:hypothetical protein